MSDKQGRNFLGVLYPDSESYDCQKVLSRIEDTFVDFAYIVHDLDVNENGEVKKAHIHWCGKKSSPAPLSTISNALGVFISLNNLPTEANVEDITGVIKNNVWNNEAIIASLSCLWNLILSVSFSVLNPQY